MNPSKMNDAELQLAIAEKLGLNIDDGDWYCPRCDVLISSEQVTYNEKHDKGSCLCPVEWQPIAPNYPGDVAAAMGLEDLLTENERKLYVKALYEITNEARPMIVDSSPYPAQFWFIHATARQRSEAWLTARRNDG